MHQERELFGVPTCLPPRNETSPNLAFTTTIPLAKSLLFFQPFHIFGDLKWCQEYWNDSKYVMIRYANSEGVIARSTKVFEQCFRSFPFLKCDKRELLLFCVFRRVCQPMPIFPPYYNLQASYMHHVYSFHI